MGMARPMVACAPYRRAQASDRPAVSLTCTLGIPHCAAACGPVFNLATQASSIGYIRLHHQLKPHLTSDSLSPLPHGTHSPRFAVDQVYDCCATYMANHPGCEVYHMSAQLFLQLCRAMHGLHQKVGGCKLPA